MRKNLLLGIIILLIGVLLLINQLLPMIDLGKYIFPAVLIFLGLSFLFAPRMITRNAPELKAQNYEVSLQDAKKANIIINHGAGKLHLSSLNSSVNLLEGSFFGGVEPELRRGTGQVEVLLRPVREMFMLFPPFLVKGGLDWQIKLCPEVPIHLNVKGGANESTLDLRVLDIKNLNLEIGASSTSVVLPASAGFTWVGVRSGAASVELHVPDGVAARVKARSGLPLGELKVNQHRFPLINRGLYETQNFDEAENKVEIEIEGGVGSIKVD